MGDTRCDDARITALALAAGAGDPAALAGFVQATQRDVSCFVRYLCERDHADGLIRETYLHALRALPSFAGGSSARTWLLSLARRVAAETIRQTGRRPATTTVEEGDTVTAGNLAHHQRSSLDEAALLRELITGLEPDRREAFVLTQVLGLDYPATAEVCDCPVGTIRTRVARAREDLVRAMYAPELPSHDATSR
jgi:RNA polymerase sigma-70 factor, ECF subfamily